MWFSLKIRINANSVSLFPLPRIRDMTSLRFSLVKTSDTMRRGFMILGADIYF